MGGGVCFSTLFFFWFVGIGKERADTLLWRPTLVRVLPCAKALHHGPCNKIVMRTATLAVHTPTPPPRLSLANQTQPNPSQPNPTQPLLLISAAYGGSFESDREFQPWLQMSRRLT